MWHLPNFSKRYELLIKPSNFGYNSYNQPITVKIPVQIIPYLIEAYHIGFTDVEDNILCYSCRKFSPGTNEIEYYVKVGSIDDINYTHLFIYYDIFNEYILSNCDMHEGLQVYEYVNDGASHPSNHSELMDCYCLSSSIYNFYTTQTVYLSKGSDYYCYLVVGWFYIPDGLSGVWGFALDSDSAAEVEIDGSVVIGWYGDHGTCGCYSYAGALQLDAGWHKFIARHEERTGGDALRVYIKNPTAVSYDDFFDGNDGDSPDPGRWSRSHSGDAISPQILSNKLQLYLGGSSSGWAKVTHKHKFVGDFDITVDYELASGGIDQKGGWGSLQFQAGGKDVRICRSRDQAGNSYNGYRVLIDGSYSNFYSRSSDLTGQLRLRRSGSNIYCYFWMNSAWYHLETVVVPTDDADISLFVNNYSDYPELDFRFNNFITSLGWEVMGTSVVQCTSYAYIGSSIYTAEFIDNSIYDMTYTAIMGVFSEAYIVSYLDFTSTVGTIFSNHGAALHQPICGIYAVKVVGGTSYLSCDISKSIFTLFFNCYLVNGSGYLVYFSSSNYVYVDLDGSLVAKINDTEYAVGAKLYFDVCSTFSITCDGEDTYVVINGLNKLIIKQTFSISEIRLGGNGSSGYSIECYFFDFFLLPSKLPLYLYYLHNTRYDSVNYFRESGYDNNIVNGYLTHWPEVIFSGDEAIFKPNSCSGVVYSASFDGGSNWHVSNLNYDSIFTRYFGSPAELDTVLKLTHSSGIINKSYITKVSGFNQFRVNYDVDFSAGLKKDGYLDVVADFTPALPTISGINMTPVEYGYEGDLTELKSFYLLKPVDFVWGGALGSGILSRSVEFCFDIIVDSWFDDVYIDFWLGELGQGYCINMFTDFIIESKNDFYENVGVDFVLSNWEYFPHHSDVICSVIGYNNKNMEVSTCDGTLMRFMSDVKVSDMLYADFNSSVFCSVSGISPYYLFDVQVISGTLASYDSDVYCSLLDTNDYSFEVKLNTIVIENFNMDVNDFTIGDLCFSVDVYDKYYGVTTSGINIYMNTNILVNNEVTNLQFSTISGGYSVSWCYDISSLGSLEYVEVIVRAINTVKDINLASYFLKYGKRYYYNLYHILKHDYETLIPMLMVAENNVDIFPSFSAESMYVRVERYKRKDLAVSIFGVGLDRSDLPASINALTTNFYNGGSYKVRVECKDLSGNIMDPFEFEFIIKTDGT